MAKETKKDKEKKEKADKLARKKLHDQEAEKRQEVRKKAEHKNKNMVYHKKPHKGLKMVKVKALCNMHCTDGYALEKGKVCEITEGEAKRLEADERMDFFEKP